MKRFAKVLLGCCICLWIVCFGQMAHAASEHPANVQKFSMAILNKRLSGIILKKYPEAHLNTNAMGMSACEAAFNVDSPRESYPCLDSRVQPRPDSTEFVFYTGISGDSTHYQRIQYNSKSSSNSITTIENRYNIGIIPITLDTSPDYVPFAGYGSWAYDAFSQLANLGVAKFNWPQMGTAKPLTRTGFTVAVARLLEKKSDRAKDTAKVKELIPKLALEFEPDLLKLGYPVDHNKFIKELADAGIVWQPRYEYIVSKLRYGKNFDPNLRKQIEHAIADYTTAWMKSNSSK